MTTETVFTSESVTAGHPDKLCDQISDAIVDAFLERDPYSQVTAETAASSGVLFLASRFRSAAKFDITELARQVVADTGYTRGNFSAQDCTVMTSLQELPTATRWQVDEQQLDDAGLNRLTADHHATLFGYACDQTATRMPLPIYLAHRLTRQLNQVRLRHPEQLAPEGQAQVGIRYCDRRPCSIHSITLVASQADAAAIDADTLRDLVMEEVIRPVFSGEPLAPDESTRIWINPEGPVLEGGPALHAGLTGRKSGVDLYGHFARQSGAAMSGKDPTRIDRSAAYAARYAARNVVEAGLASECEVQLSYSIGQAAPVGLQVDTFGTGKMKDTEIQQRLAEQLDFRVGAILRRFELRQLPGRQSGGFYRRLASYGQVGRDDLALPWERSDLASSLG